MSIGNKTKASKKTFAGLNTQLKKLRTSDPIQFDILYNEWKRKINGRL